MHRWWVFLHVLGVFGFLMAHGVSAYASLRLPRERRPRSREPAPRALRLLGVVHVELDGRPPARRHRRGVHGALLGAGMDLGRDRGPAPGDRRDVRDGDELGRAPARDLGRDGRREPGRLAGAVRGDRAVEAAVHDREDQLRRARGAALVDAVQAHARLRSAGRVRAGPGGRRHGLRVRRPVVPPEHARGAGGRRLHLDFVNQDDGVQHNVAIYRDDSAAESSSSGTWSRERRPSPTTCRRSIPGRTTSGATCTPR